MPNGRCARARSARREGDRRRSADQRTATRVRRARRHPPGGVLLGGGVETEGNIRGIAVNIAARMEQTAPSGGLRISQDTYRQVRGMFEVEPQPPMAVKGVDERRHDLPRAACQAARIRVATRGIEGVETPHGRARRRTRHAAERVRARFFAERPARRRSRSSPRRVSARAGCSTSSNWTEARAQTFDLFRGRAYP